MVSRSLRIGSLLAVALCAAALLQANLLEGTIAAQTDTASQQDPSIPDAQKAEAAGLLFRQSVRRVIVDVVVSDANGKPVSGLTSKDFSVAEDGKPQRIRSFDTHDFDAISDSLPKLPASLPANTFVNIPAGPERGPLYVLLLDVLNIGIDDQPRAREQLQKFIRSKPLGTRFAIFVLSDGLYLVQGFTEDRNLLADAVDPKNPRAHIPRIFLYADNFQAYFSTPRALIQIAKFLADLPGHKNVIWFSSSFPSAIMPNSDPTTEALNSNEEIKEATDSLARGQVAVYPVDVRGSVVTHVMSGPHGGAMVTTTDSTALNASYMTEEEIAHQTGGRAFYGTNDLAGALNEATETGGRYYTLSYSPSNQNYNGHLRHINVELSKRGYHLAYRRSYYGDPSWSGPQQKHSASELQPLLMSRPADSLTPHMQYGAPMAHQLLFKAHLRTLAPPGKASPEQMASLANQSAYFRERGKNNPAKPRKPIQIQTYEIDYSVAARYPALEVAAAAFDADGQMVNGTVQRVSDQNAEASTLERHDGIYHVQQQFDVPVSAVSIRLAVRDVATDNVGAMEVRLPLAAEPQTDASALPVAPDARSQHPSDPR